MERKLRNGDEAKLKKKINCNPKCEWNEKWKIPNKNQFLFCFLFKRLFRCLHTPTPHYWYTKIKGKIESFMENQRKSLFWIITHLSLVSFWSSNSIIYIYSPSLTFSVENDKTTRFFLTINEIGCPFICERKRKIISWNENIDNLNSHCQSLSSLETKQNKYNWIRFIRCDRIFTYFF